MAISDFTGKNIQDTYQRVVQTDGTNLADGTGSLLPISFEGNDVIVPGALKAQSYIVSESIINVSSGSTVFGDSADDSHNFNGAITASGGISSSGQIDADKIRTGGRIASSVFDIACVGSIDTDGTINSSGISNSSTYTGGGRLTLTGGESYIQTPSYISASQLISSGHITASGNISASSGDIIGSRALIDTRVVTPEINTDTTLTIVPNITASGNISASGIITAEGLVISDDATITDDLTVNGNILLSNGSSKIKVGDDDHPSITFGDDQLTLSSVQGDPVVITNPITVDGNITSTGNSTLGNTSTDTHTFNGHITASGNISASGELSVTDNAFIGGKLSVNTTSTAARVNVVGSQVHQLTGNANTFKITGVSSANALFVSSSTKVGIGTQTPGEQLEVVGNISASGTGSFAVVGIGTTNPSSELHIKTSTPTPSLFLESTGGSANFMRFTTTDGTFSVGQDYDDNFSISNRNNITSGRVFTMLQTNGNVGIGTTSPGEQLEVVGNISASGDLTVNNINGTVNGGTF